MRTSLVWLCLTFATAAAAQPAPKAPPKPAQTGLAGTVHTTFGFVHRARAYGGFLPNMLVTCIDHPELNYKEAIVTFAPRWEDRGKNGGLAVPNRLVLPPMVEQSMQPFGTGMGSVVPSSPLVRDYKAMLERNKMTPGIGEKAGLSRPDYPPDGRYCIVFPIAALGRQQMTVFFPGFGSASDEAVIRRVKTFVEAFEATLFNVIAVTAP